MMFSCSHSNYGFNDHQMSYISQFNRLCLTQVHFDDLLFLPGGSSFMGKSLPYPKPYSGKSMVTCGPQNPWKNAGFLIPKNMGYIALYTLRLWVFEDNKSLSSGGRLTSHHFAACVCVSQVLCRLQECFHVAVSEAAV